MDSGNSGSMQSSSGGDEEYDSRSESISAFFNSTTTASLPNLPPPPPTSHHHHQQPPAFYDTLSYLDSNPNPLLNLDMPWARSLRPSSSPNPSFNDIASMIATSSYSPPAATAPLDRPYSGGISINPSPVQQPAPSPTQPPPTAAAAPRSSKKRSRASRRAPTTVLTTDTSNFRAMVQEFTGIPASPFASSSSSSSSHFPRPRFDLFHPAASTFRSSPLSDAPPPYILRPFAQKVHAPPFGSTSSAAAAATTNPADGRSNSNANASIPITSSTCSTNNPTSTNNYQLSSSDLGQHHRPPLNIQTQILNFQSLLQSPLNPKYTMPPFAAATRSDAPLNLSEAGYSPGGELGLPILITSEGMHSRGRGGDEHPQLSAWAGGSVLADDAAGNQPQLMPAAGNSGSCKLNYSAPAPPDFHEKGPESATARGEGNSGSMQSSSGGDEEYDSRSESISAFFNSTTTASLPNLPPPPPTSHHHHQQPPAFYDTLSYLDSNPNPLLNLDMPWARSLRPSSSPNPSFNDIASMIATSSYSPPAATAPLDRPYSGGISINPSPVQQPAPSPTQPPPTAAAAPRSSKKRSRASRRAPTTVLTTDTSNFRAMVQEFTGIPASPFASSSSSSSSHFPRPRFDLFHPAASTFRSSPLSDAPPPYILRPFAQKVHAPPFGSTSSAAAAATTNPADGRSNSNANASIPITSSTCSTNNPTSTNNYQLSSSDLGQHHRPPLNIQTQILNFQSLLQSPLNPKYTMPPFAAATRSDAPLNLSEAGYSPGGELGLPILITSEGMHSRGRGGDEHPQLSAWAGGSVLADDAAGNQPQLMPAAGNSGSCKLNYSAPAPPDFHEKGPESATARGEGMMDSWICTSD